MKLYDRDGKPILDWRHWTRPKKDTQWRASRSAMELARSWFTSPVPIVPPEILSLLRSHIYTQDAVLEEAWPERVTPLPFRGEGRNHDMVIVGTVGSDRLLVSVEGKVDETMGPPVGEYWKTSKDSKRSKAWRRIDALLEAVFGADANASTAPWRELPYQMLTAVVGTAIEAKERGCTTAVVCIHELLTESATDKFVRRNENDLAIFMQALGVQDVKVGQLYGPFTIAVPATDVEVQILVGKAQYHWAAR